MRSKQILSIAAFITAFGLSAAFASLFIPKTEAVSEYVSVVNYQTKTNCFKYKNNSATAVKLAAFINQDKANGRQAERVFARYEEEILSATNNQPLSIYAEAVEDYVADSSSMKFSDLPGDFQVEWAKHMKAWKEYSEFLERMKKASNRSALSNVEIKEIDDFHNKQIETTWTSVLQTGRKHGAKVSRD